MISNYYLLLLFVPDQRLLTIIDNFYLLVTIMFLLLLLFLFLFMFIFVFIFIIVAVILTIARFIITIYSLLLLYDDDSSCYH